MWHAYAHAYTHIHIHTDRQTDRQTDTHMLTWSTSPNPPYPRELITSNSDSSRERDCLAIGMKSTATPGDNIGDVEPAKSRGRRERRGKNSSNAIMQNYTVNKDVWRATWSQINSGTCVTKMALQLKKKKKKKKGRVEFEARKKNVHTRELLLTSHWLVQPWPSCGHLIDWCLASDERI